MKILLVNKFLYTKGGSEKYMFDLADVLRPKGHQVKFFGMNDPKNIVETPKEHLVNNIDFHQKSLSILLYPFKIIYSQEARHKIRGLIEEFKPDIVHLNNYNFQITPSIIYELKKYKIPIIQTLHDPILVCPAHLLYNLKKILLTIINVGIEVVIHSFLFLLSLESPYLNLKNSKYSSLLIANLNTPFILFTIINLSALTICPHNFKI